MCRTAPSVFLSYSHKDEYLRDELAKHLKALNYNNIIASWDDHKIRPGEERDKIILENLNSAQIILLLVSSDYIASNHCCNIEIPIIMDRHNSGTATVIPIILRPCDWQTMPFGSLQALPENAVPVIDHTWQKPDNAFTSITKGIRKAIDSTGYQKNNSCSQPLSYSNYSRIQPEITGIDSLLQEMLGRLIDTSNELSGIMNLDSVDVAKAYSEIEKNIKKVHKVRSLIEGTHQSPLVLNAYLKIIEDLLQETSIALIGLSMPSAAHHVGKSIQNIKSKLLSTENRLRSLIQFIEKDST
ncbi:MAG: toll/interleukin-1 receptor domain-containing protein [Cyanobacteria bacterium J06650_10]